MENKSIEFESQDGVHFIKDLSIFNGVSYKKSLYGKFEYVLYLYYYSRYKDCEGIIICERDSIQFDFSDKQQCIDIYEKIKNLIM